MIDYTAHFAPSISSLGDRSAVRLGFDKYGSFQKKWKWEKGRPVNLYPETLETVTGPRRSSQELVRIAKRKKKAESSFILQAVSQ
jgi:hypothetical protein